MLFLLSPAKSLDFDTPVTPASTQPRFTAEAARLIEQLRRLTPAQVAELMDLSDALAQLNVARFGLWQPAATPANSKPAMFAFNGDVYAGLDASSLAPADVAWAQDHLVILSGLYGVLRPLDALQPYRLEMGTRLATVRGSHLYAWWGDRISRYLNERQGDEPAPVIINLASQEYFKAVDRKSLRARVVECVFEEWKSDRYKIVSFYAKRARGLMARWAIRHRVVDPAALADFDLEGYRWDAAASEPARMVFRRRP